LPILQEFGLPATVFVTSGYVGKQNMWNDRIVEAVRSFPGEVLDLQAHGLGLLPCGTLVERQEAVKLLTRAAKYLPQAAREALAETLEPPAASEQRHALMLTPAMLIKLVECGIEIGAHTVSHPILAKVDDLSAMREMRESKMQLEEITGKPVRFFAYPNGKAGLDFDDRHISMAKELGFAAAFASSTSAATGRHEAYQIPRCHPWDATPAMFGLRLLRWLARS
jgi:peptidoglycan/xylan/chitin deacetylase (PgdA/CDA1 family)